MRLDRFKNFITQAECDELNAWADEAAEKKWLDVGRDRAGVWNQTLHLTSRIYGDRFEYPQLVITIRDRIRAHVGVDKFPIIYGHGRDGVVVSRLSPPADVFEHVDPLAGPSIYSGTYPHALRCNILTRKPRRGGELYLCGNQIDIEVGELHCYVASSHPHGVTAVEEGPSRVLWMFGAYVPSGFWE